VGVSYLLNAACAYCRSKDCMRVLLVADYSDAVVSLAKLLRASGQHVFTAASGAQAIVLASCIDAHITMAEPKLADMRGDQLAALLRGAYPAMLLVALSGWPPSSLGESGVNAFDCYFARPADRSYVLALLNTGSERQAPY
jgi:response regulator RpfG family c-di-GMP phosphodiesterase